MSQHIVRSLSTFCLLGLLVLVTSCAPTQKNTLTSMFATGNQTITKESEKATDSAAEESGESEAANTSDTAVKAPETTTEVAAAAEKPATGASTAPMKETITVGSTVPVSASRGSAPTETPLMMSAAQTGAYSQHTGLSPGTTLVVRTTAYCHKEADSLPYGKLNAEGTTLKYGGLVRSAAADWSVYPVGTKFRIVGQPYEFVIDDYGSALVGTKTIDLYKPTFAAMNEWGVRHVSIQIIQWGSFARSHKILHGRRHVKAANHVRTMLYSIEKKYGHGAVGAQPYRPVGPVTSA
ncbi:MAG: 3D domain-containing protein [Verrucomicrobiota bacterium]